MLKLTAKKVSQKCGGNQRKKLSKLRTGGMTSTGDTYTTIQVPINIKYDGQVEEHELANAYSVNQNGIIFFSDEENTNYVYDQGKKTLTKITESENKKYQVKEQITKANHLSITIMTLILGMEIYQTKRRRTDYDLNVYDTKIESYANQKSECVALKEKNTKLVTENRTCLLQNDVNLNLIEKEKANYLQLLEHYNSILDQLYISDNLINRYDELVEKIMAIL
jgi:hypothetical protein